MLFRTLRNPLTLGPVWDIDRQKQLRYTSIHS